MTGINFTNKLCMISNAKFFMFIYELSVAAKYWYNLQEFYS